MYTLLKTFLPKKLLIGLFIDLAEWASQQSDNILDDKLVKRIKNTFDPEKIAAKQKKEAQ